MIILSFAKNGDDNILAIFIYLLAYILFFTQNQKDAPSSYLAQQYHSCERILTEH